MGQIIQTEEQMLAVGSLRRFLQAEIDPLFNREYRDHHMPKAAMADVLARLAEFGLVSGVVGEAHGGMGLDWVTSAMLFEEVAAISIDASTPVLVNSFGAYMLEHAAPVHLRERYLPGLIGGQSFVSIGISEPGTGSNVAEIRTRATRHGDDYVISGEKTWISNGSYSDFMICTCRTSEDPKRGLSHILLDRVEHPYETREIHKIAANSQSTAQVFLDEVRVPVANRLGEEGDGLRNTLAAFELSRIFVAIQALGLARRALEESIHYATERRQHGKVIAGHQLIAAMLAEMATKVDAARLLVHRAAALVDAGQSAIEEAAMAKYFAAEAAVRVCRQAVQIHGGNGVTRDFLVEKLAREAIIVPIPEGTTQIQQLIIARALTGVSAF
jgi:alkylation response protein AidB-like acyl-CoA dehydrogenase